MIVGDEDLLLCGMIDQLFYNVKANELQIWDYKTNKEINTYSKYKNKMTNGLNHLQECEYNTYSLQLGIYKKIIEKNTNLKLGNSYICWINEQNDTYKTFKMADMVNEVDFIFNNLAA
jgi:ATP-dependent exoDNAse (exonuclease V) beta subunit